MVPGLKSFRESFSDFADQYVIIGGAACDIYMDSEESSFRATKDLDIVLIVEALTPEFVSKFWQYVQTAGYQHIDKSKQKPEFYRFSKPISKEYPAMIELFSRPPYNVELSFAANVVPIHVDDSSISLSAILLNDEYYEFMKSGRISIDGISILDYQYIIPFKAKAWLDLSERKISGESIDSKNIKKHKNDIFRLSALLLEGKSLSLPDKIAEDMLEFITKVADEPVDMKSLGLRGMKVESMLELICKYYMLR